ncbi:MAG: methionyl-tRNA formyltransferase, partial [Kiritimatiellae bacterium]|nr:methionyl-tRNA formyltransferase [Kiritimatiellia bacterium]
MADGLRIVAMGSGALLCPAMEAIARAGKDQLVLAVTQPDRPAGRGKRLTECPAKATAARLGVETATPADVNEGEFAERLRELKPDVLLVAAYGQFLGKDVLETAR